MTILNKWVCTKPWNFLDVNHYGSYMCCPSWLPEDITNHNTPEEVSITKGWFSEKADRIRKSMLDGSFRYCNHKICPELSEVLAGRETETEFFKLKKNFKPPKKPTVEFICFGQDRSCNIKCPSCRSNVIPNDRLNSLEHIKKQQIQDEIENNFSNSIKRILLTGSGDPIYSKIYRDFLINFDKTKYPQLEEIQIVTNGILLNKKMWNSFNCKEFIKILEISFAAGTKNTYENVTRLGGNWDKLISNVKFLAMLADMKRHFIFSFVVSEYNFKEMVALVNLIDDITNGMIGSKTIRFSQHVYWNTGALSQDEVKKISIFDPKHLHHDKFLKELKTINKHPNVSHNFHHLIQ